MARWPSVVLALSFGPVGRQPRQQAPGTVHHVVQRGNDGRPIFLDDGDRRRYLRILEGVLQATPFGMHAYCLMGNHAHLLVEVKDATLSSLIHRLGTGHARAFNARWGRRGHLFQGRFHSSLVADDTYLLACVRYIHANPVVAGLVRDALDHAWSSHRAYVQGGGPSWLRTDRVLRMFAPDPDRGRLRYARWLEDSVVEHTETPSAPEREQRRPPPLDWESSDAVADRLVRTIGREYGLEPEDLRAGTTRLAAEARAAVVLLAQAGGRVSLRRLAAKFDCSPATLSEGARRLRLRNEREPARREWWNGVRRRCSG